MLGRIALTTAVVLVSACGRTGFEAGDGELDFVAGDVEPFGGAQAFSIAVGASGASLEPLAGFNTRSARLAMPLMTAGATAWDNRLYLAGGASDFNGANCTDEIFAYDPVADEVTLVQIASHTFRGGSMVAPGDGFVYHFNGYCVSASEEKQVYRFVPDQTALESVGGLPLPTFYQAGGHLPGPDGNRVVVAAGGFGSGPLRDVIQYIDPVTGTAATSSSPLPTPRCLMAGAVVGDVFYVFGGRDEDGVEGDFCAPASTTSDPQLVADVIAIEVSPERTEVIAQLPEPLAAACAVPEANGKILVMGGLRYEAIDGTNFRLVATDQILELIPATGEMVTTSLTMPEPRYGMSCALTESGRILIAGGAGADDVARDDILLFEPYADSGTLLGPLLDAGGRVAWTHAAWEVELPVGSALIMELRVTSGSGFADDETGWEVIEQGELPSSLPLGRYAQWRATLTSTNGWASPVFSSLSLSYVGE